MAATFSKPENVLNRAEELINVGRGQEALDTLHGFITTRRYRAWTNTDERIMFKYVELCVDTRRGRHAKDGLIHYRGICQQVNITSLEEVINHFMQLATDKAELARNQAEALEWFKFLWETYRTVLEIVRNNSRLEALYATTARRAFQFCKQYKRTTEFRSLCELIRNHLANLNKYRDQRDRPDLTAPDSLRLYLGTRFEQLNVATELELWQEAFRSIEDIHGLMCMVKQTLKPGALVVFYYELSVIFWTTSSHLYHAYAWLKLFSLHKRHLNEEDLQLVASAVVLAALSVPPYDRSYGASHTELENERERNLRVANLIAFDVESKTENREVLSRSSLLFELVAEGVMNCVNQEVKDLYHILEHENLPFDLTLKVQPLLSKISKLGSPCFVPELQFSQYVPSLEKLSTLRLLQRVSQVYQSMNFDNLSRMIPFFDFPTVEKISLDAIENNFLAMKVDYRKCAIFFGTKGLESEVLRGHLSTFAVSLGKVRVMIYPPAKRVSNLGETLPDLVEVVEKEHKRLLARKSIIEKRKEEQERQLLEMQREEEAKRLKLQKITEEAEQKRLSIEFEQMKNERIRRELEERAMEEAQTLLLEAKNRNKQEMEKTLVKLGRTMDYLERAKREEAAPLIEASFQQRLVEEEALHELEHQRELDASRQRNAGDLEGKRRLSRMLGNKNIFQERVLNLRKSKYEWLKADREMMVANIIQTRKEERDANRKLIFFLRCEEERQKRLHEEEEARKGQVMERRKKEEGERKAKLDEIAKKQRQRERELEKKERQRMDEILGRSTRSTTPFGPRNTFEPVEAAPLPAAGKFVPSFKRMAYDGPSLESGNRLGDENRPPQRRRPG